MHTNALRYMYPKTHIHPAALPDAARVLHASCCQVEGQAGTSIAEAAAPQACTVCRGPARAPLLLFQRTADGNQQRSDAQPAAEGPVPAYGFPARSYAEDLAAWPGDSSDSGRALPVLQVLWLYAAAMLLMVCLVLCMTWQPGLKTAVLQRNTFNGMGAVLAVKARFRSTGTLHPVIVRTAVKWLLVRGTP